eukprot:SAG31_NODE_3500_length_4192_cov_2.220621_3_plen_230_part_00
MAAAASPEMSTAKVVFLLFSFHWTTQVVKYVVHVTAAGAAATWYFQGAESHAVRLCLHRALTTSLGSICFGALFVAVIRMMKTLGSSRHSVSGTFQSSRNPCIACGRCIGGASDRLMNVFNHYAFTNIAIYGYSYSNAARATYALLQEVGFLPLMNHFVLSGTSLVGCTIGGSLSGLIAVGWSNGSVLTERQVVDVWTVWQHARFRPLKLLSASFLACNHRHCLETHCC